MKKRVLAGIISLILSFPIIGQNIDRDKSTVKFEISNMAINTVKGAFKEMKGKIRFDPNHIQQAHFDVCIGVGTVSTGSKKRDEHLLKEDFFHASEYPNICITSTKIEKQNNGYLFTGFLTMRGKTQKIQFPFTYASNTFLGHLKINRTDYEVGGSGGFMVGEDVQISIICIVNKGERN